MPTPTPPSQQQRSVTDQWLARGPFLVRFLKAFVVMLLFLGLVTWLFAVLWRPLAGWQVYVPTFSLVWALANAWRGGRSPERR